MKLLIAALVLVSSLRAQLKLPPHTHKVLPNGLVLDLLPKPDVPLVKIRMVVRGGTESEPIGVAGIASLTAELLGHGTTRRSARRFSEEMDSLGATFSAETDEQSTSINMELLSKDIAAGFDLFTDLIANPVFNPVEVRKTIALRVDGAKGMKDNLQATAGHYFRSFFFGPQHPYGRQADELSYARIQRSQIAAYHSRTYVASNMIVVIAGDIEAASLLPQAEKAFGAIRNGNPYRWNNTDLPKQSAARMLLVEKPDSSQTYFQFGTSGIPRRHPDRIPLLLVNTVFGGRFTSMLMQELRVNSGLTYGAYSRLDQARLTGGISVNSYAQTEKTAEAMRLALAVMKRLHDNGLSAEQLASAKTYLKGTYPPDRLETADQLAEVLAELELYDLDRAEIDDFFNRVDAVSLDQANAVATKYLNPENLTFLLLGNTAKIRTELSQYSTDVSEVSINEPGLNFHPSNIIAMQSANASQVQNRKEKTLSPATAGVRTKPLARTVSKGSRSITRTK
jgi:predicted Zn-dependent peptidase